MNAVRKKATGFVAGVRSPLPSEPLPSERVMLGTVRLERLDPAAFDAAADQVAEIAAGG